MREVGGGELSARAPIFLMLANTPATPQVPQIADS